MDALTTCNIRCAPAYYISGTRSTNTDGLLNCSDQGVVTGGLECSRKTCTVDDITGFFGDPHAVAGTCNTIGGDPNSMQMFANSYCKLGCAPGYRGVDSAYGLLHCRGGTGPYNRTGILTGNLQCLT